MWESPRPPLNSAFRGRPEDPFNPSRLPQGFNPRIRGPAIRGHPPFPFHGATRGLHPRLAGHGVGPFAQKSMDRNLDGFWEEGRNFHDDQSRSGDYYQEEMNQGFPRRERVPMNFRAREMPAATSVGYGEREAPDKDYRSHTAPDMDYRERGGSLVNQSNRDVPDVDYRNAEFPAVAYRERLPLAAISKEREVIEYRERLALLREREAAELEHRERLAMALEYRGREVAALEYEKRMTAMLELRERRAPELREREAAEMLLREREVAEVLLREREAAELLLRERQAGALRLRERDAAAMDYRDRRIPDHYRECNSSETATLRYREGARSNYQERIAHYNNTGNTALSYTDDNKVNPNYMDHRDESTLVIDYANKEIVDMDLRERETAGETYKEHKTIGYKEQETKAYRKKGGLESTKNEAMSVKSATGNRDNTIPGLNYGENTDSDYRAKESVDTDYRERESVDADYRERESADSDYREKDGLENLNKHKIERDRVTAEARKENETKDLKFMDPAAPDYMDRPPPTSTGKSYKQIKSQTPGVKKVYGSPSSGFKEWAAAADGSQMEAARQEKSSKTASSDGAAASRCKQANSPGKLDTDFRDQPNPEVGYKGDSIREKPCSDLLGTCDQDLRSKENFAGRSNGGSCDQDFRTTAGYVQKKDEDLRDGKTGTSGDFVTQNSLIFDFLQLAAQELSQKQGQMPGKLGKGQQTPSSTPVKPPVMDFKEPHLSHEAIRSNDKRIDNSPDEIEFIGRQDADYRNMDYKDVDLRVKYDQEKRSMDKRSREELQTGSKDKDYRRASLPEGATRILWMDGLPTGGSREEILYALYTASKIPENVNLIGYIPGYSLGSVCVEFSLVEDAVRCMEANKGSFFFKGKKVTLKYIPNSDRWNCQQCKVVNVLSKERCWQCSALRSGSDHVPLKDYPKDAKTTPAPPAQRGKKRKTKQSAVPHSPEKWKEKTPPREKSFPAIQKHPKKGTQQADLESKTVILKGLPWDTCSESVLKALEPFVELSPRNVRIMKYHHGSQRGANFAFIDLKSHKEAARLTAQVHQLKPPLTINGNHVTIEVAVWQRRTESSRNEQGRFQRSPKNTPVGQAKRQRGQRRGASYTGRRADADGDGASYVFDPNTGLYIDPLTDMYYDPETQKEVPLAKEGAHHREEEEDFVEDRASEAREQRRTPGRYHSPSPPRLKTDGRHTCTSDREEHESEPQRKRAFREDMGKAGNEELFKKPLPPPTTKKDQSSPEPKVNPLIGLIGEYGDDSEEEEDQEQLLLPPLRRKTPPRSPPRAPVPPPKPVQKPAPSVSTIQDNLTDWKKMACLLCRRQFPNKDALTRHLQLSDLHKQNLAIHQKIKQSEKELAYLQERERKENQSIQRRLQEAKRELEQLEREEGGWQETDEYLQTPEKKKPKVSGSSFSKDCTDGKKTRTRTTVSVGPKPASESYRENLRKMTLARFKNSYEKYLQSI
ncbi:RNA-binding protein 6-like [Spea bombifrons]|uniref:RNA-binding protein 6-like n=1 Tax=Spea bombifrons TaxID=233779 RepID=UPI0023496530|nr:RNA-binding protein 6-like [Spea bombifrons]